MYSYTLSKRADSEVFRKACLELEQVIPDMSKEKLIEEADGSLIQIYKGKRLCGKDFCVWVGSDSEVEAVYIASDIELTMYKAFETFF